MIYKHQYGFRKKNSTNHAPMNITEQIRKALDNNKYALGAFVDFQKAFDTVDHNIILENLIYMALLGKLMHGFDLT